MKYHKMTLLESCSHEGKEFYLPITSHPIT